MRWTLEAFRLSFLWSRPGRTHMDSFSSQLKFFFVPELEKRSADAAAPKVKSGTVKRVKCEMEGRVSKAYRRHATLTGLTLLMVHLASRQHFLSSAVSHFFHISFSLVTLRYEAFSLTSAACFFPPLSVRLSLNLTFSTCLFCFASEHYIALSLTFASCFLPSVSFLSFFFLRPSPLSFLCLIGVHSSVCCLTRGGGG